MQIYLPIVAEPPFVQELFDFARTIALVPGATTTLYFSLPSLVAATVSPEGVMALTPGSFHVRIGDIFNQWVEGTVNIMGRVPVKLA